MHDRRTSFRITPTAPDAAAGAGIPKRTPASEVPPVLRSFPAADALEWYVSARPQVLGFLAEHQYGFIPPRPETIRIVQVGRRRNLCDGRVHRRTYQLTLENAGRSFTFQAAVYSPADVPVKAAVASLNFYTLDRIDNEPERYPLALLAGSGIKLATISHNDLFPDRPTAEARKNSIYSLYGNISGRDRRFTAISAWAFGYQLLYELLQTPRERFGGPVWAQGHSRLGKTALWAVANDPRFAGVVSNQSGCGGAAIYRDKGGEDIDRIVARFPYWFVPELDKYRFRENELPWDQNWLMACIAPRPLLVTSATEDAWACPENEFLAAKLAGEVYRLFGVRGIAANAKFPAPDHPLFTPGIGYYVRTGRHTVLREDWRHIIDFMKLNGMDLK